MPKAQLRGKSPSPMISRPNSRGETERPSSVLEDGDGYSTMTASRPPSLALMPPASASSSPASPPSLRDILTNIAPPPYTLGAFTAFLSQNHCLETLEFTMDADRYRSVYSNFLREQAAGYGDGADYVCSHWQKIINAYIVPYGHREVNLPAHVRDRLLSLPATPVPPHPTELDEAVRIVYELMNDSVLGPFLASVAAQYDGCADAGAPDSKKARSRLWIPKDSSPDESGRSPKMGFLPMLNIPWTSEPKSSASSASDFAERGGLTEDSANTPSPTGNEPMTPPTTPPVSDWGFSTSPGGLHKTGSHSSGWKKMGAKLGLNRMGRSKRGHSSTTSAPTDFAIPPRDPDHVRRRTNPL
ncbi:regulator of G protein signaling superfamily [Parathielavia appendiculata]|uniref:Regulator of G protein signaling superfamily n=1 Tax=Parathielavia appendiculata TaxID=2587402 RepID=A0AAN6TV59_9PEZI|nr:regulator of G protein signaling superfamily [Parathielavia appendiculata]